MEKTYTVREAALNLGCNERTVYRAIWEDRLKAKTKEGKEKYLISEENLKKFQDSIRGRGKPAKGEKPSRVDLQRLYVKEQRSIRDIAELLGCSKDAVYRALQEYGIERRPKGSSKRGPDKKARKKRQLKLKGYYLRGLEKRIVRDGITKAVEDLGITRQTLVSYIKKRKRGQKKDSG